MNIHEEFFKAREKKDSEASTIVTKNLADADKKHYAAIDTLCKKDITQKILIDYIAKINLLPTV